MSNYTTKNELEHATGVDTSNIAAKSDFIVLKVEINKLDTNKLINALTDLNDLRAKIDDLDLCKLKIVPIDLDKVSDLVDKKKL